MIELEVGEKDMQAGRVLDAGWYPLKIKDIELKPKNQKPSEYNIVVNFDVIGGSDKLGPAEGVYVKPAYFPTSPDAPLGNFMKVVKACGVKPERGMKLILDNFKNRELDGYLKPSEEYQGVVNSEATAFAELGAQTKK